MLNNLKILNGSITPNFESSIYNYEVVVNDTVFSLLFEYDVPENAAVTIYGNDNLKGGENHVLLEFYDGNQVKEYIFKVLKKEISQTFKEIEPNIKVNEYNKNQTFIGITIFLTCIIIIIFLYYLIFKPDKK